ncbi:MAG: LEA type 2 family protein [Deinococcales bacterium]
MRRHWWLPVLALVALLPIVLTACAPATAPAVAAPSFTALSNGTGFEYVDPPGVGDGAAVFDIHLRAYNPNPFAIGLRTLDTQLYLAGSRAATGSFRSGVQLPAEGTGDLTLQVRVPLSAAPRLVATFATLAGGGSASYRLNAVVGVQALGVNVRFPQMTVGHGSITWNLKWYAPEITIATSGASLKIDSLMHATFEVPATLHNPARIGYLLRTPRLQLQLAGRPVATANLGRIAAPAGETVPVKLRFEFNPLALGPALAAELQAVGAGAGQITFIVSGPLTLDAAGISVHQISAASLLSGNVH